MNAKPETESHAPGSAENREFRICTEPAEFPASETPSYLQEGIGGVCTSGRASIQVFDTRERIAPGSVFTLLPWQLVSIKEISPDFRMTFFRISPTMFLDILSGLCRLRPDFYFYMRRHFAYRPIEGHIRRFLNFCDLLDYWDKNSPKNCRRETIIQFLRTYYWTVYAFYLNDSGEKKARYSHKEELAFKFMHYIIEEHSPDKEVSYYAQKLNISSKTLTNTIRSISGQSAHEWIVYYTLCEIKSLLRNPALDIKSIASKTNFPDQASLSRYFRRYTGMSPSQYRESFFF